MINCSPSSINEEETLSTLRFGMSARSIKNKPKVNLETSDIELRKQFAQAKQEILDLRAKNMTMEAELLSLKSSHTSNEKLTFSNSVLLKQSQQKDRYIHEKDEEIKRLKKEIETIKGRENQNTIAMNVKTSNLISELVEYKKQCTELQSSNEYLKLHLSSQKYTEGSSSRAEYSETINNVVNELVKIKTDRNEIKGMVKGVTEEMHEYIGQIVHTISSEQNGNGVTSGVRVSSSESLSNISERDVDELENTFSNQELRDYICILEDQKLTIHDELEEFLKKHQEVQLEEGSFLKRMVGNVPKHETREHTGGKVVVPIKGGFKKRQYTANDSFDEDEDEETIGNDMIKCGYLYVKLTDDVSIVLLLE